MDDMSGNLERMAEELVCCIVCTNKFFEEDDDGVVRIPKILDCTHTFCDKCISRHLNEWNSKRISSVSNFPCPTCRKTSYVPLKGIGAFPTDLKVKQIMELLKSMKNIKHADRPDSSSQHFCQTCHFKGSRVEGNFLCLTCQKIFCGKCRKLHQSLSFFASHSFYNLKSSSRARSSLDSNHECIIHCSDLEYSCTTCKKSLCCICVMMPEHRGHRLLPLRENLKEDTTENIYEDLNVEEMDATDQLNNNRRQTLLTSLKDGRDRILGAVTRYEKCESFKVCEDEINRACKEAQKAMKDHQQELLSKLKIRKANFDKATPKKEELLTIIKGVDKILSEADKGKRSATDTEKMEQLVAKINAYEDSPFHEAEQFKCSFKSDVKVVLGELVSISGENASSSCNTLETPKKNLPFQKRLKKSSNEEDGSKRLSVASQSDMESRCKTQDKANNFVMIDALLKSLRCKSLSKKTKLADSSRYLVSNDMWQGLLHWCTNSLLRLRNVCFVENDEILVVIDETCPDAKLQLVGLRSSDGNPVDLVVEDTVEPLERIRNISYCNDTKHLYLLGHRLGLGMLKKCKISFNKKNMGCLLKCVETTKLVSLKNPIALAVSKKFIAVLENNGTKVTLFSHKYEKLAQLSDGDFDKSSYITIDKHDRIILNDFPRREIKVFKNEDMVLKFSSTGPKRQELLPQGIVAVTKQNNILVADQALNGVSLYNSEGNLQEVIVENVDKPWGICYSEAKHLLAVATDGGLRVYKL